MAYYQGGEEGGGWLSAKLLRVALLDGGKCRKVSKSLGWWKIRSVQRGLGQREREREREEREREREREKREREREREMEMEREREREREIERERERERERDTDRRNREHQATQREKTSEIQCPLQ